MFSTRGQPRGPWGPWPLGPNRANPHDTARRIIAFLEHGDTFARLSSVVGAETRLLLEPRPPGLGGRPLPDRRTAPPALADGIRVGHDRDRPLEMRSLTKSVIPLLAGQKVYIVPSLELVVVFTGGSFNVESPVNALMARVLLPALLAAGPVAPGPAGRELERQ